MAIVSYGYDGSVDEVAWAKLAPSVGGSDYGTLGAGDWKVTAGTNPGQLNIAAGTGWGRGVLDVSDAIETITQSSLPSSGTRWDMVVRHRDWTPPNGVSTATIIQGSSTKQLPARDTSPGVVDDQPLALVQWTAGQTAPTAIVDLRCWGGNGGMYAMDDLALGYLGRVGARVKIGAKLWSCELDSNGSPQWVNEDGEGPWVNIIAANGWVNAVGRCRKVYRGAAVHVDLETKYTGTAGPPKSGWFIGYLPAGYKPANPYLCPAIQGSNFQSNGTVWIGPNDIQISPPGDGVSAFKVSHIVALQ